jgi:hypothetical protein
MAHFSVMATSTSMKKAFVQSSVPCDPCHSEGTPQLRDTSFVRFKPSADAGDALLVGVSLSDYWCL